MKGRMRPLNTYGSDSTLKCSAAVVCVIAIAGCGGSSDATTASTGTSATTATKTEQPRRDGGAPSPLHARALERHLSSAPSPAKFVHAALTVSQPRLACLAYTPDALTRAYGGVDGCEAAVRSGGSAGTVEIRSVLRDGPTAHVVAIPNGGPSSGERLTLSLLLSQRRWRIDAIHSNAPVGP